MVAMCYSRLTRRIPRPLSQKLAGERTVLVIGILTCSWCHWDALSFENFCGERPSVPKGGLLWQVLSSSQEFPSRTANLPALCLSCSGAVTCSSSPHGLKRAPKGLIPAWRPGPCTEPVCFLSQKELWSRENSPHPPAHAMRKPPSACSAQGTRVGISHASSYRRVSFSPSTGSRWTGPGDTKADLAGPVPSGCLQVAGEMQGCRHTRTTVGTEDVPWV